MNARIRLLVLSLLALAFWSSVVFIAFQWYYAPNVLLYKIWTGKKQLTAESLLSLEKQALESGFGMTDSLRIIDLSEQKGHADTALAIYSNLVERFPEDADLRSWYADYLSKNEKFEQASEQYQICFTLAKWPGQRLSALKSSARNAVAAADQADGHAAKVKWLEIAAKYYLTCIKDYPEAYDAIGEYANLLLKLDRPKESLQQYEALLEIEPDNTGWLSSAVIAASAAGNFRKAEKYLFMLSTIKSDPEIPLRLARIYFWDGNFGEALPLYDELLRKNPGDIELKREMLDVLFAAKEYDRFMRDSARHLANTPDDRDLWKMRIDMALEKKDLEFAEREATSLLSRFPEDRDALLERSMLNLWLQRYEKAKSDLKQYLADFPENQSARKYLAQAYLWNQEPEKALEQFRIMGLAVMDDRDAAQGYSEALQATGTMSTEDLQFANEVILRLNKTGSDSYSWPTAVALARAMKKVRNYPAARALFESALKQRPRDVGLKLEYADLLQDMGFYDLAERIYRTVLE